MSDVSKVVLAYSGGLDTSVIVRWLQDTYGWLLHKRGGSAEALPILENAAKGLPRDPMVQYHLGQVYLAEERPEDALAQFRKSVNIAGPTDTRPQIEEARTLIQSLQNPEPAEN